MSFKEISGVYEISDRHPEFNDIYNNTKGTYKRPTEIIAKCRAYKREKAKIDYPMEFQACFQKQNMMINSAIIEIDVVRIVVNRDGENVTGFEKIE